jgi:anti-anti-sigma factor
MISVKTDKEFVISILDEIINNDNADRILKDLRKAAAANPAKNIIVDLAKVKLLESSGIAILVSFEQFTAGSKRKITLKNIAPTIRNTIDVLNLSKFFNLE